MKHDGGRKADGRDRTPVASIRFLKDLCWLPYLVKFSPLAVQVVSMTDSTLLENKDNGNPAQDRSPEDIRSILRPIYKTFQKDIGYDCVLPVDKPQKKLWKKLFSQRFETMI